ncbi:oligopeptide ABC transporter substrate-binding protein [Vagococcus penaei]|uniref:Oligopeptide ABC transporter substrate-binding protein n=1 Tax=Vagococcus penaei TaxID=633807 RepID=A0A1Q2D6V0_9ENTE|nr:oligopeptide ABC transporter substrate-binding protein [Vagococcus penaei]AQP54077.1 oligopeptide ABC transporter substrate-binding protein [Vagococcus penaei]RST98485.1 oligopeptide ABC transporter substrate-binding protein [Vagococcus penaei]
MKYKKLASVVALGAAVTVGLAACGSKDSGKESSGGKKKSEEVQDISKFPIETKNKDKATGKGTLDVAVAMDTSFQGLFDPAFNKDAYDSEFMGPAFESLFGYDDKFQIDDSGVATLDLDKDAKKVTIKLVKDAKWTDGKPVVADDIIQPYLVIGNKDYPGTRYGAQMQKIIGMKEYHEGKADNISGIKKIDDKTVEITYESVDPGILTASGDGGAWQNAMPAHIFKDIPVKDMESSDAVRKNPVSFGPYKMAKITRGESVEYTPNEYYYGDKPQLDKIIFRQTPTNSVVEGLKAKKYDMVISMPTDTYPSYKDVEGYEMLGRPEFSYTYIGFKMGKWDKEKGGVSYNPEAKMSNKSLRQAMAYAVDNQAVGDKFYYGLRSGANSLIPPALGDFNDKELKGYTQDIDKANKLLDDAGYKKKDGDEFRSDPDGNKLEIKFASMAGGETAQPLAEYYMDQWKAIGLDVKLATGRLIDFNQFYDKVQNDDPEIDVYQAAWSVGLNPSQTSLYGPTAAFNFTRFESEENSKLLSDMDSDKAFDSEYRLKVFKDWQNYAHDEAFAFPTLFRSEILPVSKRVTDFNWDVVKGRDAWAKIGVTSDTRE